MCFHRERAFTILELVVVLAIIVILAAILMPTRVPTGHQMRLIRDGSQIMGIHQSWLIYARDFDGTFPVPSRTLPQKDPVPGVQYVPCHWNPQFEFDTTAHLFSLMIMQNYFTPEMCVGPKELSDHVFVCDTYNWDLYDPASGNYWDVAFVADLQTGSNVSYAHMPLFGENVNLEWRESLDRTFPIIGNRGPRDGDDPDSMTYQIYYPHEKWSGNIVFNDNHVEYLKKSMNVGTVEVDGQMVPDNIFKMELGPAGIDVFLGITKAMTEDGPVLSWD